MTGIYANQHRCAVHGSEFRRDKCRDCNAAYQRNYLQRRRQVDPIAELLDRAKDRGRRRNIEFSISRADIFIPAKCPALGIPIVVGGKRSEGSPSLDRIDPNLGYVPGNVRVLSDRANRLKSNSDLRNLTLRLTTSKHADDLKKVRAYLERELLLREVRMRAKRGGRSGLEWAKVEAFLDRAFAGRSQSVTE